MPMKDLSILKATTLSIILFAPLAACGMGDDRSRSIARCERQMQNLAPDTAAANAMCTCIVDSLAAEGMTIIDTLGDSSGRGEAITRQCAIENGVPLP